MNIFPRMKEERRKEFVWFYMTNLENGEKAYETCITLNTSPKIKY